MCRSPRRSASSTSCGNRPGGGPLEFAPRFAQLGRKPRADRAWRRLLPRCGRRSSPRRSVVMRKTPYSLIFRPRSLARPRRMTLWSFEPVKYCSAAPKLSAGTTRRSTCRPLVSRIDDLGWPAANYGGSIAEGGEVVHRRVRRWSHDEKVEIADRFAAAAITAGGFDLLDRPTDAQVVAKCLHVDVGLGPIDALGRPSRPAPCRPGSLLRSWRRNP